MDPEVEAPAEPDTPEAPAADPYETRYNDLRSDYDKKTPLAKNWERFQSDEAYRAEVLTSLGYEIDTGDDEPEVPPDPNDALAQEVADLRAWREEQEAERQRDQEIATLTASLEQQFAELPDDVTEAQQEWIGQRAANLPRREDGMPDIATAYEQFNALVNPAPPEDPKVKPKVPRPPIKGRAGEAVPDLDDEKARVAWMAERYASSS